MAGPKAPIGTLTAHSQQSAKLARSVSSTKFGSRATKNTSAKQANIKEESSSDSSDSESDASDAGEEDHNKILREISSKSSGAKSKPESKSQPAKKPVVKREASPAESKAKKTQIKKEPAAEESSSEDSSSDSDSESESESSSESEEAGKSNGSKSTKKSDAGANESKAKVVKKSESESSSGSESSSSSSSEESESGEEEGEQETKKAKAPSSSESSSSEESASESDEEADESMAIDQRNGNNTLSGVPEVVSSEFHLRKADDSTSAADVAQFFSEAKMEGKQLWYFTAPASIPIEVVEELEIPLERAQKGLSILSHNGDDYGVAFEDASTSRAIKLVIPNKAGDQYHMMNGSVAQTMHLKRVTQFSRDGESTLSLTQTAHTTSGRPPRPQPKGLKARFQPIGVTTGTMGKIGIESSPEAEDVDMTDAPALPSFQKTPGKKTKNIETPAEKEKKRKLDAVTDATPIQSTDTAASGKKSKKARFESEVTRKASKETPIAPPVIPSVGRLSSSQAPPASTSSSSKASKASLLPSSQPTPTPKPPAALASSAVKKESKVPLPPSYQRASSSMSSSQRSSPPKEEAKVKAEPKTNGKSKEKKSSKAIKTEPGLPAPKKTTPVPVPHVPS